MLAALLWVAAALAAAETVPQEGPGVPDLGLTAEEKAFLAERVVRLGVDAARPPFEFFDKQGQYSGISAGFVAEVAKRLGLAMVPQADLPWTEAMGLVKTGGMDVIPKATPTPEREKFLIFTRPYVTFPTVIVSRKERYFSGLEDIHGLKVGVVKGLVPEANLTQDHPDMDLTRVPNLEAGLRALSTGTLDAFVDNLGAITYTIDSLGLTNLKIAAPTPYTQDLAMGVRKDWPLLASALDKALASISSRERAAIKSQWLSIQMQATIDWWEVMSWALPLLGGLLLVMVVILRANRRMGREVAERKRAELRFQTMAANVPGAIFQVRVQSDGRRQYTYLSPRAREFFGVAPEVVIGEGRTLNWHPDDKERIARQVAASFATRTSHNLVGRVVLPQGTEKWVNLTASPNPQPDGDLIYDGFMLDVTERKLAEQEYLASERKIKAMSQAVDDALVMLDSQGQVVFFNPAAERLFGYTMAEAMGMDFHAMAAPQRFRDQARLGMEEFARSGQGPVLGTTTETQATNRAGRVFPVEVTLSSFQVDDEWFAVGTVRDISARKQAEEAIKESERRLGNIIEFLPDPTLVIDAQGRVLAWNRAMESLSGVAKADILGKGDYENALPFYGERRPILANLAINWDEELAGRYLHIRREGEQLVSESFHPSLGQGGVYLSNTAGVLRDATGQVVGAIQTSRDVTARKQMEERLREREAFFRAVFDNAGVGIVDIGPDGLYMRANQSFLNMLGYTWDELKGLGPVEVTHPEEREWTRGSLTRLMSGEVSVARTEKRYLRKDGSLVWGDMVAVPILDQEGRFRSIVATVTDITERKRAEALMVEKEVAEEAAAKAEAARQEAEAARQWAEVAQEELKAKVAEIERFNRLALGREERIMELKRQANTLAAVAGFEKPYAEGAADSLEDTEPTGEEEQPPAADGMEIDSDSLAASLASGPFLGMMEAFWNMVGVPAAIIDLEARVLASSPWQRACTDFHRKNEVTCARCIESDTDLALRLNEGQPFAMYRCNNGLTDCASPLIIEGKHVANVFVGQFFTEQPDMQFFLDQALDVGLDPTEYLAAIAEVPVVAEERLPGILNFLVGLARMVTDSHAERQKARRAEEIMARRAEESLRERAAALSLAEDAEEARAEIEQYKGRLELLVAERTEELKLSEERSRLLLDSAGEGIFGVDARGMLTFINPAALKMLGLGEQEIMGQPVHPLIHHSRPDGSTYPVDQCPMHASFTDGTTHHVDDEVLWRQDGHSFPVEYSSTPVTKEGRVVGAVITFRDISERKRAEEEMRQYTDDLERFNRLTLGREERMIELKEEINGLLEKAGQGKKYKIVDETELH